MTLGRQATLRPPTLTYALLAYRKLFSMLSTSKLLFLLNSKGSCLMMTGNDNLVICTYCLKNEAKSRDTSTVWEMSVVLI